MPPKGVFMDDRPTLERLIKLNGVWLSRNDLLHGIKSWEVSRRKIRIVLDCGDILVVNNSRTSASARALRNSKYKKVCKKCRLSDERIQTFVTKSFHEPQTASVSSVTVKGGGPRKAEKKSVSRPAAPIPAAKPAAAAQTAAPAAAAQTAAPAAAAQTAASAENKNTFTPAMIRRLEALMTPEDGFDPSRPETLPPYKELEALLTERRKQEVRRIYETSRADMLAELERDISSFLREKGFMEIKSSILIPEEYLLRMGIDVNEDGEYKVFKTNGNMYLRPMLAPVLYNYLRRFDKILPDPVKIFEIGTCYRRESDGSTHLEEFTMVNFCQMGKGATREELTELIGEFLTYLGIEYKFEDDACMVYGDTVDVLHGDMELSSAVVGPVPMDVDWGINKPWIGAGFGLERLLMAKHGFKNVKRGSRSELYYNGTYINL